MNNKIGFYVPQPYAALTYVNTVAKNTAKSHGVHCRRSSKYSLALHPST